jgi:uncharacterized membrane protein
MINFFISINKSERISIFITMIRKKADGRLWEIDLFRGIALCVMIIFHFLYDLNHFSITNFHLYSGFFSYLAQFTASIFVILAGVSLSISYVKAKQYQLSEKEIQRKFIIRGLKIFFLGMVLTFFTWYAIPERYIVFGVLHCIGASIILSILFLRYHLLNYLVGIIFIGAGLYLRTMTFDFQWLLPLGLLPQRFYTIDYFPLLPWFGVVLFGIALGKTLYPNAQRRFYITEEINGHIPQGICFFGRHSLHVYMLHQPILLALIFLLFL